jgi:hypothetical protein
VVIPRRKRQDRQSAFNVTLRRVNETVVAVEKQCVKYIRSVRACGYPGAWTCACAYVHIALLIQHETRMRNVVTSFVAPRSPLHFFDIIS